MVSKQNLFTEARVSPGTHNGIVHLIAVAPFWSCREKITDLYDDFHDELYTFSWPKDVD